MEINALPLTGAITVRPKMLRDSRGYFFESFNAKDFARYTGIDTPFIQDNQAYSKQYVIRGLHYQAAPVSQAKLVSVVQGVIWDVIVDLRKDSDTFMQWYGVELSSENRLRLYVPHGFAHGYAILSESAIVQYKCDAYYEPTMERGIRYDDSALAIDWRIAKSDVIISDKDARWPLL